MKLGLQTVVLSLVGLLAGASVLGCAGASSTAAPATSAGGAGGEGMMHHEGGATNKTGAMGMMSVSGPDQPWKMMEMYDREMYMVGKVQPIMHDLFAKADGRRYSSFDCEACHGKDVKETKYAMPSKALPSLPKPGTPEWAAMEKAFPESVRFMKEVVTPTMGKLLGVENYTCMHCHTPK